MLEAVGSQGRKSDAGKDAGGEPPFSEEDRGPMGREGTRAQGRWGSDQCGGPLLTPLGNSL